MVIFLDFWINYNTKNVKDLKQKIGTVFLPIALSIIKRLELPLATISMHNPENLHGITQDTYHG